MWFESLIESVQRIDDPGEESVEECKDLSSFVTTSLKRLQEYDRFTHEALVNIKLEEKLLAERLENEIKSKSENDTNGENIDENYYRERMQELSNKRQKYVHSLFINLNALSSAQIRIAVIFEYQMKIATDCYDLLDKKIGAFDEIVKPIASHFPYLLPSDGVDVRPSFALSTVLLSYYDSCL